MDSRTLGSAGLTVSEQGLGCMGMSFGYTLGDEGEAVRTIHRALDAGVTLFDTADMYGPYTNERLLGSAVADRRSEVVLASKVGQEIDAQGQLTWKVNGTPDYVRKSIDGTLGRLGVEQLDLYYLHRIDASVPIEDTFGAMSEMVEQGKVRHLGLSEASAATIRRAHAVHPVTAVQTEYSLLTRDVETNGVLEACRELGIGFVAYSPLCRGLLSGKVRGTDGLGELDFRRIAPRFHEENIEHNLDVVDQILKVAESKGVTASQMALAWVLSRGQDCVALPGTKRTTYLDENLTASQVSLSESELAELDRIAPPGVAKGDRYPDFAMAELNI